MEYDVVIVGAGICGLTAALELKACGINNVILLEAADRVGGRAKTVNLSNGQSFNEGANWFHGGDDNPFFRWAKARYDLGELVLDDNPKTKACKIVWNSGSLDQMRDVFSELDKAYDKLSSDPDISLHDVAASLNSSKAMEIIEFMAQGWMAVDNASKVAAREYFEDPLGPGGWQMAEGMDLLMEQMAADVRKGGGVILCNSAVTGIFEKDGVVHVSAAGKIIKAATALITVSPPVLSSRAIMFEHDIQKMIAQKTEGIIMGNLVKLVIPVRKEFFEMHNIQRDTPIYMVDDHCFVHVCTAGKSAISLFKGGQNARDMEQWGQAQLQDFIQSTLSKIYFLNGYEKFMDGDFTVTQWGCDPLQRGSYSICKPGFTRSDPFAKNAIFFSGEAFLADPNDSPGQMAGAWAAGKKVATMISDYLI